MNLENLQLDLMNQIGMLETTIDLFKIAFENEIYPDKSIQALYVIDTLVASLEVTVKKIA